MQFRSEDAIRPAGLAVLRHKRRPKNLVTKIRVSRPSGISGVLNLDRNARVEEWKSDADRITVERRKWGGREKRRRGRRGRWWRTRYTGKQEGGK
eukprot:768810-Hanusia_phi.AAC.17